MTRRAPAGRTVLAILVLAAAAPWCVVRAAAAGPSTPADTGPAAGPKADHGYLDAQGNWVETEAQRDRRMAWWRDARFGMFIHWGLYSVTAGQWKGKWQTNTYGEWIQIHFHIPVKEYETIAGRFNPVKFDADAWVRMARDAGMKYIVITSKHHDGFALFKSEASAFNIVDATPFGRDPMKELADACRKHGLRLCFYYSQSQDWHEPDGLMNYWDFPEGVADKTVKSTRDWVRIDFQKYIDRKAMPQMRELLTRYGPLGLVWYDTPRTITDEQARAFVRIVRQLQPDCLVNSRVSRRGDLGDYGSTGDNAIPGSRRVGDWEMPGTMNDTWGYRSDDDHWRSAKTLIQNLVDIVSKGGNYLLNVGPTGEGEFPPPIVERLRAIGDWMKVNSPSLYGTQAGPFGKLPWGRCTVKDETLYLHVFDWPKGPLVLRGLANPVRRAYLLADAGKAPLAAVRDGGDLRIDVPAQAPDANVSVVVLEVEGEPAVSTAVFPRQDGSVRLEADRAAIRGKTARLETRGDDRYVAWWVDPADTLAWEFRAAKPGTYAVEVTGSNKGSGGRPYTVTVAGQTLAGKAPATGSWTTFQTDRLGTVTLDGTGPFTLTVGFDGDRGSALMNLKSVTLVPAE